MIHNSWGKKKNKQGKSIVNPTSCWKKKSIFLSLNTGDIFMFVTTWMSCILKRMYVRALLELFLTFQVKQRMDSILSLILLKWA